MDQNYPHPGHPQAPGRMAALQAALAARKYNNNFNAKNLAEKDVKVEKLKQKEMINYQFITKDWTNFTKSKLNYIQNSRTTCNQS